MSVDAEVVLDKLATFMEEHKITFGISYDEWDGEVVGIHINGEEVKCDYNVDTDDLRAKIQQAGFIDNGLQG